MQLAEDHAKARYVMIGGFLGAGKTTSILKFAEWLTARGLRVGLITNDQGGGLVDTALVSARRMPVEEIVGGCFCCRFNSLVEAADSLMRDTAPDVLIAEPVGSCTDLVATVSLPLEQIYGDRFTVAPVTAVVDPLRAERVLGLAPASLSEHVCYIYRKQLEEAEIIVINKSDLVDPPRLGRLRQAIAAVAPQAVIHACSARDGTGLDPWFETLQAGASQASAIAEIDYDEYAYGESLLGWLNAEVRIGAADAAEFDGTGLLVEILSRVRETLAQSGHEVAHMKGTLSVEGDPFELAAANLVRTEEEPAVSHRLAETVDIGRLLLNLRAEAAPEDLESAVRLTLDAIAARLPCTILHIEHFRPGRPVPTHRLTARL
ncbi:MAG: cobalamin biosynthesis protein P47K [Planctomycetota bacterium]|jgi:G3E family GTPase|nr:cobalamin biosynthesis protein P47K [Planctomycetota bacterium]